MIYFGLQTVSDGFAQGGAMGPNQIPVTQQPTSFGRSQLTACHNWAVQAGEA